MNLFENFPPLETFKKIFLPPKKTTPENTHTTSESAWALAFAIIMLNTDAHNPVIKKKMSKVKKLAVTKFLIFFSLNLFQIAEELIMAKIFHYIIYLKFMTELHKMKLK